MELLTIIGTTKIILATNSPRRRELLESLKIPFKVHAKDIDESYPESFRPEAVAVYIAEKKANSFSEYSNQDVLVVAADTLVTINGIIFGKPKNEAEATSM